MNKDKISSLDNLHKSIFVSLLGLSFLYHFLTYPFQYYFGRAINSLELMGLVFSLIVITKPREIKFLVLLLIISLLDIYIKAPIPSNHTMVIIFIAVGLLFSISVDTFTKNSEVNDWFIIIKPYFKSLLLMIYFFSFFAKLNYGFLDNRTSCSVVFFEHISLLGELSSFKLVSFTIVISTLLVECGLFLLFFSSRSKKPAIFIGTIFHLLLPLSSIVFLPAFSSLCLVLHCSLLPREALIIFYNKNLEIFFMKSDQNKYFQLIVFALFIAQLVLFYFVGNDYGLLVLPWYIFIAFYFYLIVIYIKDKNVEKFKSYQRPPTRFPKVVFSFFAMAFAFNAISPYIGLKTNQSLLMFSNLRIEGDESNHVFINQIKKPFEYLNDTVVIHSFSYSDENLYTPKYVMGATFYQLLNMLDKNRKLKITFTRNKSNLYKDVSYKDIKPFDKNILHSRLFRKYFSFKLFDFSNPVPCNQNALIEGPSIDSYK